MRLRRIGIGLAVFIVVLGILAVVLRGWAKRRFGPAAIVVQVPEVPEDNGYDNFLRATELYVGRGVDLSTKPGMPITAEQKKALLKNQAVLAELRRGLGKKCVVPLQPEPTPARVSRSMMLNPLACLLLIESALARDEGRFDDAVPPLLEALRFGAKLQVGSWGVDWLTGHTTQYMALSELQPLVGSEQLGDAQLSSVLHCLVEVEATVPPTEQRWEIERRMVAAAAGLQPAGVKERLLGLSPQQMEATVRRQRDEAARLSQGSYAELRAAMDSPPRRLALTPGQKLAWFSDMVSRMSIARDFQIRSVRRGMRVLSAVQLYRLRQGKLPQSLRALESLDTPGGQLLVIDPLTDKPYIYRVRDGDYFLYSVGMDLKDDGGAHDNWGFYRPGDIVFHKPADEAVRGDEQ